MKTTALLKLADALESEHGMLVDRLVFYMRPIDISQCLQITCEDVDKIFKVYTALIPKRTATRIRKFVAGNGSDLSTLGGKRKGEL